MYMCVQVPKSTRRQWQIPEPEPIGNYEPPDLSSGN